MDVCKTCQVEDSDVKERVKLFYNKIDKMVSEADKYAVSVWQNLSNTERNEWLNYINKLRQLEYSYTDVEWPIPPNKQKY
jgi:hypothetical protein